jgi:aarF domain-containing kinase
LLHTYTTHIVRTIISTRSLIPLPPQNIIPARDETWEARERKFHEENVKQINDMVRRMNAVAPSIARRSLVTLQSELDRVRGDVLQRNVWAELERRSEELQSRSDVRSTSSTFRLGEASFLRRAANRSLSTISSPVGSFLSRTGGGSLGSGRSDGMGASSDQNQPGAESQETSSTIALGVIAGIGCVSYIFFRQPSRNDSEAHSSPAPEPLDMLEAPEGILSTLQTYLLEPLLTFFRFLHLFFLFAPVILTSPMLLVGRPAHRRRPSKPVAAEEDNWGAVWWYGFLVKQMERAGPSFIKLGQWAASRADLFPASLCDRMSKLHSNGKPHSLRHTKRIISNAFGMSFDDIFEDFGEEPIGCGAIAQVYKARLRKDVTTPSSTFVPGTTVAIKVLHPRARKTIRRDIAIMSIFANAINALPGMQWISLPDEVAVFGEMMNSQLDLRVEASNLDRFEENFGHRGRQVTFPRPIKLGRAANGESRQESKEVLMEEFEDALPLKHFLRNGGGPFDDIIANMGLDAFLEMLLLDNWTHGDLHP